MTPTEAANILSEVEGIALPVLAALEPGPAAALVKVALDALVAAIKAIDKDPEPDFAAKLQASVNADVAAKVAEGWK